jgi:hypothetical protein
MHPDGMPANGLFKISSIEFNSSWHPFGMSLILIDSAPVVSLRSTAG